MYRCDKCHFAFTQPLPLPEEFAAVYAEHYSSTEEWLVRNQRSAEIFWPQLTPFLPTKHFRFLEVGGAYGYLSAKVKNERDADVVMLECGKQAARHASDELGITVVSDFFENYLPEEKFDVIFSSHVVEHLRDVKGYFTQCADLLNPGGVCIVVTPNASAWKFRLGGSCWCWAIPEHLYFLSAASAREIARTSGFASCESRDQRPFGGYPGILVGVFSRMKNLWKFRTIAEQAAPSPHLLSQEIAPRSWVSRLFACLNWLASIEQKLLAPIDLAFGCDELLICARMPNPTAAEAGTRSN